jgi:hypothetical protein
LKKVEVKLEETTKKSRVDDWLNLRMDHGRKKYKKLGRERPREEATKTAGP